MIIFIFFLEPNVSVTITFNSLNISEVPDLRFFGQRERVSYFEQMACTNCLEWNSEGNFLEELSKLLGKVFFMYDLSSS